MKDSSPKTSFRRFGGQGAPIKQASLMGAAKPGEKSGNRERAGGEPQAVPGPGLTALSLPRRPFRIAVVDPNQLVHVSVGQAVVTPANRCVVQGYQNPAEFVSRLPAEAPDVVLMAIEFPGTSGIEWTERLRTLAPRLPVIMHTTRSDAESIFRSILAGARGYLIKPTPVPEIRRAVACALAGWPALCPLAAKALVDGLAKAGARTLAAGLSPREREVAACLFLGLSRKEISQTMRVAPGTVHAYLSDVLGKLKVHSLRAAVQMLLGLL